MKLYVMGVMAGFVVLGAVPVELIAAAVVGLVELVVLVINTVLGRVVSVRVKVTVRTIVVTFARVLLGISVVVEFAGGIVEKETAFAVVLKEPMSLPVDWLNGGTVNEIEELVEFAADGCGEVDDTIEEELEGTPCLYNVSVVTTVVVPVVTVVKAVIGGSMTTFWVIVYHKINHTKRNRKPLGYLTYSGCWRTHRGCLRSGMEALASTGNRG